MAAAETKTKKTKKKKKRRTLLQLPDQRDAERVTREWVEASADVFRTSARVWSDFMIDLTDNLLGRDDDDDDDDRDQDQTERSSHSRASRSKRRKNPIGHALNESARALSRSMQRFADRTEPSDSDEDDDDDDDGGRRTTRTVEVSVGKTQQ